LYVIVSGAAPARDLPVLVSALTADWDTCMITTPSASELRAMPSISTSHMSRRLGDAGSADIHWRPRPAW
jgi:hypothetical protein